MANVKSMIAQGIREIPVPKARQTIMIESDDWGAVRMPSKKAYDFLLQSGAPIENDPFARFDKLESSQDLDALYEVLRQIKNVHGKSPIITANTIMGNPDFEAIQKHHFEDYHWKSLATTIQEQPDSENLQKLWKQAQEEQLFYPQYHGKEHVNVPFWMQALKDKNQEVIAAFTHGVYGINFPSFRTKRANLMASLDFETHTQKEATANRFLSGLTDFKNHFGYTSESIIAPTYVWSQDLSEPTAALGVKYWQGLSWQFEPMLNQKKFTKRFHYTGQKNQYHQQYLVRNCFFEPSIYPHADVVSEALKRIDFLFKWNKPVIIGSHRLNFMGGLVEQNRTENLKKLKKLLQEIVKKYPAVRFTTSDKIYSDMNHEL